MACVLLDGNSPAREDVFYELSNDVIKTWFKSGRYGRMGTIGDGSCFFHSVCLALNRENYKYEKTDRRKEIAIKLRHELSENFTEEAYEDIRKTLITKNHKTYEIIKDMLLKPSTWAEEIMIKWTSKYLNVNIIFLNLGDNENRMYCGVHDTSTAEAVKACHKPEMVTLIVAWISHEHFELVVRLDSVNENKNITIRTAFMPKYEKDLLTIQNVMRSYITGCRV